MTTPESPTTPASAGQPTNRDSESQQAAGGVEAPGTGGSRLEAAQGWLRGRTDSGLGLLAALWLSRYFEASWNSAPAAVSTDIMLSA